MTVPKPDQDPMYRKEILAIIQAEIDSHPRSAQAEIGPSEVGGCPRKVAWKMAYGGESERQGGWAAARGTEIHAWMDRIFKTTDRRMPDGTERFLSDLKLDKVNENVNGGTLDLYDRLHQIVWDFKCPGDYTMRQVRNGLPSEGYYVQTQIYARGLEQMGHPVAKTGLIFLPACGDDLHSVAKGAMMFSWPYDRQVAEDAFAKVDRIKTLLDVAPPAKVFEMMEIKSDFCSSCPVWIGNNDRRALCPGADVSKPMRQSSTDPFAQ